MSVYIRMYVCLYVRTYVYISMCVCARTRVCVCIKQIQNIYISTFEVTLNIHK